MMSNIINHISELLKEDMVSYGLLVQCIEQDGSSQLGWKMVLTELLSSDIEIGTARLVSENYVEFIAWNGPIDERVSRAEACVNSLRGPDQEFAYWLALHKNVDRFEVNET